MKKHIIILGCHMDVKVLPTKPVPASLLTEASVCLLFVEQCNYIGILPLMACPGCTLEIFIDTAILVWLWQWKFSCIKKEQET